jgi:hypothetical protein
MQTMKRRDLFCTMPIAALMSVVFSSEVSAVSVFTNRSAWESAAGSFVTEDFNALTPFEFSTGLNSVGLIDIDVTGPVAENQLGGPLTLSGQFAIDGTNHVIGYVLGGGATHPTIIFAGPILGFGADWTSTASGGHLVTMSFDGTTIHFDDYLSGDGTGFLGVIATNPFTEAVFGTESSSSEGFGMDNLEIIPEPSAALLLAIGLAGLAAAGRRRLRH